MLDMGKNLKRGDNVTALTYTGGPAGGTYLRLTALDLFDGNTWRISPRQEGQKITNGDLSPAARASPVTWQGAADQDEDRGEPGTSAPSSPRCPIRCSRSR